MKPKFSTLIILTLVCAVLMVPFALSPIYLDMLRDRSFDLHQFLRGEWYKQVSGFVALALVGVEMLLTFRKRSRSWSLWPKKLSVPGSVIFWRSVHIFVGTALVGAVLVHTIGATGINFNALFLWIFFAVTLSALAGVVAETGVLESPRKVFSIGKAKVVEGKATGIGKGALIRGMRAVWLPSHIFLVSVFALMLAVHIFLVYYYR
ncbi:MAG: hypothetical protein AB8B99_25125 [Phormidesmis sp.]